MQLKNILFGVGLAVLLLVDTYVVHKVTKDQTVQEVVDNITEFCYNSGGAIIEGSNNTYIFCQGVKVEVNNPQEALDKAKEV